VLERTAGAAAALKVIVFAYKLAAGNLATQYPCAFSAENGSKCAWIMRPAFELVADFFIITPLQE
jgi:hypothetical protein